LPVRISRRSHLIALQLCQAPSIPLLHIFCICSTLLGSIVEAHVFLWPRCDPSSLPACSKSLLQGDGSNALIMSKTCHAVRLMEASCLSPRMPPNVLRLTDGWSQMIAKVPIHHLTGYGIDDIDGMMPRSCYPIFSTSRTFWKLHLTAINRIN